MGIPRKTTRRDGTVSKEFRPREAGHSKSSECLAVKNISDKVRKAINCGPETKEYGRRRCRELCKLSGKDGSPYAGIRGGSMIRREPLLLRTVLIR